MKPSKMIRELDTAVGMLIVAATQDPVIKEAMEKVSNVSFELGNLIDEDDNLSEG